MRIEHLLPTVNSSNIFSRGGGAGIKIQQPITLSQVQLEKVLIMSSEVRLLVQIAQVSFTLKFILWQMVGIEKVKISSVIHSLS